MKNVWFLLISLICLNNSFAITNADSVFNPSLNENVQSSDTQSGSSQGPATTYTSTTEYQYGTCPSGFTYNGSSQFPLQARTVTYYYTGSQYVGNSTSPWYDMDADCTSMEYQQIPCPTNYTGVYYQQRQVTTSDGGYQYSDWTTYANSCVYNPPITYRDTVNDPSYALRYGDAGSWSVGTGVAIDYSNQELRCVSGFPITGGGDAGAQIGIDWKILDRGQGFSGQQGLVSGSYCQLSNNNKTANIAAGCAYTSGGDGDFCVSASSTATIQSVSGCTMTVQITGYNPSNMYNPNPAIVNYNICK